MGRDTVRSYLVLSALFQLGAPMVMATYVTFLQSHGLNLFQVNMVNLVFWSVMFVTDIPTGAFADTFGRRLSFCLACCLYGVGMFTYAAGKTFGEFAIAEAIVAIGATFANGAFQGWLRNRLGHQGYRGATTHIFAR